jgi:hypothetical protein
LRPIDVREWRWVSALAGLLLALAALPYSLALARPPQGRLLTRTLYYGQDLSQYLSAMGDGAASASWLVHDHLTAEPHVAAFMYPFYVLLGKAAALLGLQPTVAFAFSVALASVALVFAGYLFAAAFLDSVWSRRGALLVILFSSGLGIWIGAVAGPERLASETAAALFAFDRAELSTFLLPFGPPHLPLALACLLLWGRSLACWSWEGRTGRLAAQLLAALGVGLLNPFTLVPMMALAAGYTLVRWVDSGRFPHREVVAAMTLAVVSAPFLAVSFVSFALDPFWSAAYGRQNTTGSPAPWGMVVQLGVILPLAVAGALHSRARREARLLLAFWSLLLLALMYLPLPYQRRFGFGLQPAAALLAAQGISWGVLALRKRRIPRLAFLTAAGTLAFGGTVFGYAALLLAGLGVGGLGQSIFEPQSTVEAAEWLAANSGPEDVVLSSFETGNYLAGRVRGRVVAGQWVATLDARRKDGMVRDFFSPGSTALERMRTVEEQRVTFLYVGPRERDLGMQTPAFEDGFRWVYGTEEVAIYRLELSPAGNSLP